ncbi:MAG: hypothetical protein R3247_15800 [Rhodothermales bacterium]|nr:hypothetical protein [Rhodothermales bacterium]
MEPEPGREDRGILYSTIALMSCFTAFLLVTTWLGGSALSGMVEGGRYFVGLRARAVEVAAWQYGLSLALCGGIGLSFLALIGAVVRRAAHRPPPDDGPEAHAGVPAPFAVVRLDGVPTVQLRTDRAGRAFFALAGCVALAFGMHILYEELARLHTGATVDPVAAGSVVLALLIGLAFVGVGLLQGELLFQVTATALRVHRRPFSWIRGRAVPLAQLERVDVVERVYGGEEDGAATIYDVQACLKDRAPVPLHAFVEPAPARYLARQLNRWARRPAG